MQQSIKMALVLVVMIMFIGCDPAFKHSFKGKVISQGNNEPIKDAKLEYILYPIENLYHWRTSTMEKDLIEFTDQNGEFEIDFSTLAVTFDSLTIKIHKDGYKEKILVSERKEWKSKLGINVRRYRFDFGNIKLEENKN